MMMMVMMMIMMMMKGPLLESDNDLPGTLRDCDVESCWLHNDLPLHCAKGHPRELASNLPNTFKDDDVAQTPTNKPRSSER